MALDPYTPETIDRIERIRERIHRLNVSLNAPLTEEETLAFEATQGITLPEGYRAFITQVGNGYPLSSHRMFSLMDGFSYYKEHIHDRFLSTPFPHTEHYNPETDPTWLELEAQVDRGEISEEAFDRAFDYRAAGTLIFYHEGCGYMHRLVVTGPTRGQVWIDADGSDQGYIPLGVDFLTWYERCQEHEMHHHSPAWWFDGVSSPGGSGDETN